MPVPASTSACSYQVGARCWVATGRDPKHPTMGMLDRGTIVRIDSTHLHVKLDRGEWVVKVRYTPVDETSAHTNVQPACALSRSLWDGSS
jgi:hypothetical protein